MDLKRKILVIDDDQSVCDVIARTLKSRDYEVFTETRYQEGLARAGEVLPERVFNSFA
jgi:ActR/RegA family two-component response regulator